MSVMEAVLQNALHRAGLVATMKGAAMTAAAKRRDHPLSMRLPEADNAVIDREASLLSRSRTEFVREAAVRAAEAVLMEQALVRMRADECGRRS